MSGDSSASNRLPRSFWVVGALLLFYVAVCTEQRDNRWGADAWEYHRVVLALSEDLWDPGNPTYDISAPSARYSPYGLIWAAFSRVTGVDAYHALSIAAVLNAGLLIFGTAALLRSYGEGAAATAALIVMFSLFGGIPGYTCSYALADLPWIGVNPSAFSMGVTVWVWVWFRRFAGAPHRYVLLPLVTILASTAMLDHGIIGGFTQVGLWLFVVTAPPERRTRLAVAALAVGGGTLAIAWLWPWFDFLRTVTDPPSGMLSAGILRMTLFQWCLPALVCSLFAFSCRDRKLVRVCLFGGYACYGVGFSVLFLPDWVPLRPALARLPLPGLIFFHLAIAIFAHRTRMLDIRTWPDRLRRVLGDSVVGPQATLEVLLAVGLLYCLVPQLNAIVKEPFLARAYIAPVFGKEDKQLHLKARFDALLTSVGRRDVVLADPLTSWPVPSSGGRIVYAMHPEWFATDEADRKAAVLEFFDESASMATRVEILEKWNVHWILLNRETQSPRLLEQLLVETAVVGRDSTLVLMDADRWRHEQVALPKPRDAEASEASTGLVSHAEERVRQETCHLLRSSLARRAGLAWYDQSDHLLMAESPQLCNGFELDRWRRCAVTCVNAT